jgi:hypothetical protein
MVQDSKPLEVLDYHFAYEPDTKLSQFVGLVRNPNESQTLEDIRLTLVALDQEGTVLESSDYTIARLAPQEKWLVEIDLIRGKAVTAEISISQAESTSKSDLAPSFPQDSFSNVRTKSGSLIIRTSGVISVPQDGEGTSVSICAAFLDKKGDLVGGMCGSKDVVLGRKNAFEVYYYAPKIKPTEILLFAQFE